MAIIHDGQVKMAHLAIVAGYSVNGVARLHTEILKNKELKISTSYSRRNLTTRQTVSHSVVSCITEIRCWLSGYPTRSETTGSQI